MTPARVLIYGPSGAGKTITAVLLALGRSVTQFDKAPIALVDPERIDRFVRPLCEAEGVELLTEPSRSFVDMQAALPKAQERGCCVFVVDHYDGIYRELTEAQKRVLDLTGHRLPYQHREELIKIWDAWVRDFRETPLDCIFTARQAWEWGDADDESGDPIKVKLGTKSRGDADASYEPDLLVEMERVDKGMRNTRTLHKHGAIKHLARVVKDRSMILQGLTFEYEDLNGYKAGQYAKVWKDFAPHFDSVVRPATLLREATPQGSERLFSKPSNNGSAFIEREKLVTITIEELSACLYAVYPGQTTDEKRLRDVVLKSLFDTRSWKRLETFTPEQLTSGLQVLQAFEAQAHTGSLKSESWVIATVQALKDAQREATVL